MMQRNDNRTILEAYDMITLLPYTSFKRSAECLDSFHLGRQRLQCRELLNGLCSHGAWSHSLVGLMWQAHPFALARYGHVVAQEWQRRGYKDPENILEYFRAMDSLRPHLPPAPPWIKSGKLRKSHKALLLQSNPRHYRALWPDEDDSVPLYWPVAVPVTVVLSKAERREQRRLKKEAKKNDRA